MTAHRASFLLTCVIIAAAPFHVWAQSANTPPPRSEQKSEAEILAELKKNAEPSNAQALFAVLDVQAQGFKPVTAEEWVAYLQAQRFKRIDDSSRSGVWEKTDSTGTLRASAFYLQNETSIWLFFVPAVQVPMPDPVLSSLLRDAEVTRPEDGGTVEARFKPQTLRNGSKNGVRVEFVRLLGSTVTLRRVVIEWRD